MISGEKSILTNNLDYYKDQIHFNEDIEEEERKRKDEELQKEEERKGKDED